MNTHEVLIPFRTKRAAMLAARRATRYLDEHGNNTIIGCKRITEETNGATRASGVPSRYKMTWHAAVPEHIAKADAYQGIFDLLTEVK